MSGDPSTTPAGSDDGDGSDDEEATLQSQAVYKGPNFLRRMLRFPEFDEGEAEEE
jgi:hypothetical protein